MPRFAYSAVNGVGDVVEGVTKAPNLADARAALIDQELFPVKLAESRSWLQFEITKEKVKKKELMHFTRQLAVFVRAGIPITSALETIGDETQDTALRRAISAMIDELRNGGTLSEAAAKHPQVFPNYYVGILRSAELTGRLDETLDSLSQYLNREIETRAKVVNALSYPAVVMMMAMVTVVILAGYVLPKFKPLFEELDADLPLPTRMLLAVASLFTDLFFVPLGLFAMTVAFAAWLVKSERGRRVKDRLVLRIPVVKGIVEYAILERFCRILAAMVRAGVPLPDGMSTTTEATANTVYRERLETARDRMMKGEGFSGPLAETELFPGAARQMFKVGEETGTLDDQLVSASEYFDTELEVRIKRFTTMFEPIMIIGVGLMVGFVAVALVSAMYGVLGGVRDGV